MDEVSPLGPTRVAELRGGVIERYTVDPEELGLTVGDADALAGGEPEENAAIIEAVLGGAPGAPRTAVVLNAAAALLAAGVAESWPEGVRLATDTIDAGRAAGALNALREASRAVSSG
jgi:anthranilate phosphoribosyltransferase